MSDTDTLATTTRVPGTYTHYDFTRGSRTLAADEQYMVILAQRLDTGTVPALTPTDVFSGDEAAVYFGRGSQAHRMAAAAITANSNIQLAVCALNDDKAGVAATGSVVLSGTASSSGQIRLSVAGTTVAVAVSSGDKAADLMASLATAVNGKSDLPLTAEAVTGADKKTQVTLTARNKGACGNETGLTLTITASGVTGVLTPMSGGRGDPDIAEALSVIYSAGHTVVVVPYSAKDALSALGTHLENVSGPTEQRSAVGVAGWNGTLATGTTLTGYVNEKRITTGWHSGSALPNGELAAVYAATIVSEDDPSQSLDFVALPGLDVTDQASWPMRTEEEKALHNGLTPFRVQGSQVQIVRAITTYIKNSEGIADDTLLDLTTIRTLDYIRTTWRTRMSQRKMVGGKLTDRRLQQVRSETLDVLYALEALEMVENVDTYKAQVTVTRNSRDRTRADVAIPAPVVRGLHILDATIYLY